jgi:glucosamine 6-phosphate synthetase-like amidotransferase/phosphosugar isomerase protein
VAQWPHAGIHPGPSSYQAGEIKFGPITCMEGREVVIGAVIDSHVRTKTLSNIDEMKARGGRSSWLPKKAMKWEMSPTMRSGCRRDRTYCTR